MLFRFTFTCFAAQHSPEKEQRLILRSDKQSYNFSDNDDVRKLWKEQPHFGIDELSEAENAITAITREMRGKYAFLNDVRGLGLHLDKMPEGKREEIAGKFLQEHQDYIRSRFANVEAIHNNDANIAANALDTYTIIRNLLNDKELTVIEPLGNDCSPNFLKAHEFEEWYIKYLQKKTNRRKEDIQQDLKSGILAMPRAYNKGTSLVFNIDHADFREDIQDDPLKARRCEIMRDMSAIHEITHFELQKTKRGTDFMNGVRKNFENAGVWQNLRQSIDTIFGQSLDKVFGQSLSTNNRYVHEVLAIYLSTEVHTRIDDPRMLALRSLVEQVAETNPNLRAKLKDLVTDVGSGFQTIKPMFEGAVIDRKGASTLLKYTQSCGVELDEESRTKLSPEDRQILYSKEGGLTPAMTADYSREGYHQNPEAELYTDAPVDLHDGHEEHGADGEGKVVAPTEKITPDVVLTNISAIEKKINSLKEAIKDPVRDIPLKPKDPHDKNAKDEPDFEAQKEYLEGVEVANTLMDQEYANMQTLRKYVTDLKNWEKTGAVSLRNKAKYAKQWAFANASEYEGIAKAGRPNADSIILADANSKADRDRVTEAAKAAIEKVDAPLEAIAKYKDYKKNVMNDEEERKPKTFMLWLKNKIGSQGGIEWLCWYDVVKIVKIYKDGIVESYHAQQNVSTARVARNASWIMDWVPWGSPVRQIIDRQARSANEEETNKYKEFLEQEGFEYDEIFEPGGVLDQNRNNINRFKAVLVYASGHGWLYKLRKNSLGVFDGTNVYGVDYIKEFTKEQFKELVQKNEQGKKHAEEEGFERIDKDADVGPIIDVLIEELHEKNIFRALGVVKRLQEKAKFAYSNTWATTTILDAIQHVPGLKEILDKGFLDQLGGIGIEQSAWTLTMFKSLRHELWNWKEGKTDDITDGGKNKLTLAIKKIHKRLDSAGVTFETDKDRNEAVAEILSARTYRNGNATISIFENEFTDYRRYWLTTNTTTNASNSDDDWFSPGNGGSDILLLGRAGTVDILRRESQGPFTYRKKGPDYFAQVIMRDIELQKIDPKNAGKNFREEMKDKFNFYLTTLRAAGKDTFLVDQTLDQEDELKDLAKLDILYELVDRDMIGKDEFVNFVKGTKLSPKLKNKYQELTGEVFVEK